MIFDFLCFLRVFLSGGIFMVDEIVELVCLWFVVGVGVGFKFDFSV